MEERLKFNSQICTTKEQSQRLLDLGLKPETADMVYEYEGTYPYDCNLSILEDGDYISSNIITEDIPAWSLHRLIEMCNKTQFGMTISIYNNEVTVDGAINTVDGDLFEVFDNTYDNLISIIEWLIKREHFNKEYLK
jgi:hypothetical protein